MSRSVVHIESLDKGNRSFGTGFVIDNDEHGVYILTCKHVLDDVKNPMVEEVKARVIAIGDEIDMAVLYVSKLHLDPLPLQIDCCGSMEVNVIGFSNFNQNMTQKKHICAKLFEEKIELHSNENNCFYFIRKIKADENYSFDRGNSGSPVFCKKTNKVIAMISNKEGNEIGYAIEINSLEEIWKKMPAYLLHPNASRIEAISGEKPIDSRGINTTIKKRYELKDFIIAFLALAMLSMGIFYFLHFTEENIHTMPVSQRDRSIKPKNFDSYKGSTPTKNYEFINHHCFDINPNSLEIKEKEKRFFVVQNDEPLFSFKHDKGAERSIFIIKTYNMTQRCSLGRHEEVFSYMLSGDEAPQGVIEDEECMGFNIKDLTLEKVNGHYEIINDGDYRMFRFSYQGEAEQAFSLILKYEFNHFCYIRNPKSEFTYLKK